MWGEDFLGFSGQDKEGTDQPYEDALVVTVKILGFNMKMVMVDQGSGVEIMYPDLYWGLGLTQKDLSKYDTFIVTFDGIVVTLAG